MVHHQATALLLWLRCSCAAVSETATDDALPTDNAPNIVLIVSDDLGWGEVSTTADVATNHRRIETPNLLRIFGKGGLVFDDAYAGYSVCGPSRTTLMAGRHAGNMYTKTTAANLPSLMRAAGYSTALFGKSDPLTNPLQRDGFDYFLGQDSQGGCHDMYPPTVDAGKRVSSTAAAAAAVQWTVQLRGNNWTANTVGKSPAARRAACMAHPEDFTYTSDVFETAAAAWIRNQTTADKATPFFAYVAYTTPHAGDWGATKETGSPVYAVPAPPRSRCYPTRTRNGVRGATVGVLSGSR